MTVRQTNRWLVLHADDYGMNNAVNEGILRAFREGLLTSTSLLANAPAASDACQAWRQLTEDVRTRSLASVSRRQSLGDPLLPFDLGIHLNLTQGRPLTPDYPSALLNDRGQFPGIGQVFRKLRTRGSPFRDGVLRELQMQIERMRDLGVQPTHLNGHQYIEMIPGVAELIPALVQQSGIRIVRVARESHLIQTVLLQGRVGAFGTALIKRYFAGRFRQQPEISKLASPSCFFGTAHAGLVTRQTLRQFLDFSSLSGCTEIGLHPASATSSGDLMQTDEWFDPLFQSRPAELDWLCDPATTELIAGSGQSLGRLTSL